MVGLVFVDPADAITLITNYGVETGEQMTKDWRNFWMYLFAHVRDGFTVAAPKMKQCVGKQRKDCTSRRIPGAAATGYSKAWYKRIVADGENKEHYGVPAEHFADPATRAANHRKILRMDKSSSAAQIPYGNNGADVSLGGEALV